MIAMNLNQDHSDERQEHVSQQSCTKDRHVTGTLCENDILSWRNHLWVKEHFVYILIGCISFTLQMYINPKPIKYILESQMVECSMKNFVHTEIQLQFIYLFIYFNFGEKML